MVFAEVLPVSLFLCHFFPVSLSLIVSEKRRNCTASGKQTSVASENARLANVLGFRYVSYLE